MAMHIFNYLLKITFYKSLVRDNINRSFITQVHIKNGYGFFPHGQCVVTVTGHGGQGPG